MKQMLRQLRDDGFCLIEGVIPDDCVDEVRGSAQRTLERVLEPRPGLPQGVRFVTGFINHDQSFAPFVAEPRLISLVEALLGPYMRISFTSAIFNDPDKPRGTWHADWPFNQCNAGHLPAPYPDVVMHLTTLFMLSPFTQENGGTLVVPSSHRTSNNPTGDNGVDPDKSYPTEYQVTGPPGAVLIMDSRLWHCSAPNDSDQTRIALAVRYAPWWLNLDVLMPGSDQRKRMVDEAAADENHVPTVPVEVFEQLPSAVKPLYRHWVARR